MELVISDIDLLSEVIYHLGLSLCIYIDFQSNFVARHDDEECHV